MIINVVQETSPDFVISGLSAGDLLAGVDEVGRGALFGPVVAAAVLMPIADIPGLSTLGVRDSKQLSAKRRQQLVPQIKATVLGWHISFAGVPEIECLNIRQASLLAMKRSLMKLSPPPDHCWIDGKDLIPACPFPQTALIRGDRRSPLIAAASILAKVWRDELMIRIAQRFPEYGLERHKGYGTAAHRLALENHGLSPLHRRHFCRKNFIGSTTSQSSQEY